MDWPAALYAAIEAGLREDMRLQVCVAHQGAHVFDGGCRALPARRAPFAEPIQRCQEDGNCRLAAGTHVHAPPTRIEIDVEGLAEAIVRASRAAREERQVPVPSPAPSPQTPGGNTILERYSE